MVPNQKLQIEYLPEAFIGAITKDGIIPHPEPADTRIHAFLVAEISPVKFFREAVYLPSHDHQRDFINTMYRWTATTIYLVADGNDNNVYCIAFGPPFNSPMLFGKLVPECKIYQLCVMAFSEIAQNG
jgi:hypothetical protein